MDHEKGSAAYSLIEELRKRPYDFDFFQAVRRIDSADPQRPRVGHSRRPCDDAVRFCQNVSLSFAPSSLAAYCEAGDGKPAKMFVNLFGLLGPNGPMPLPITEYVYDRLHNRRDKTLASFLDIFNHRMLSLFYRAWACNQQSVSHDRKQEDRFAVYIGSMFGIGTESFRDRDVVADIAKLHYSGRLVCHTKNAEGLREILQDYFGTTVNIQQFVGQWIELPAEHLCRLGSNGQLGSTLIIGAHFWECQQRFRIRFGPMSFSEYQRMLPGSDSIRRLVAWVRNYVGDEFCWDLQLILRAAEVPRTSLAKMGRLGWSTWLCSRNIEKDADDLVIRTPTV
ncbi:MAG: type VI secretion system baseplate subunit TssG [Planctomycetota bacterium]|jgi:type VI secretion system protein ImpH